MASWQMVRTVTIRIPAKGLHIAGAYTFQHDIVRGRGNAGSSSRLRVWSVSMKSLSTQRQAGCARRFECRSRGLYIVPAQKQMAMRLRFACPTRAQTRRSHSHIQHPLAPEPWQQRGHDVSWRPRVSFFPEDDAAIIFGLAKFPSAVPLAANRSHVRGQCRTTSARRPCHHLCRPLCRRPCRRPCSWQAAAQCSQIILCLADD